MSEFFARGHQWKVAQHEARVRAVLDQAVADGASLYVAAQLGEPDDVIEVWVDKLWDGLRDNLIDRPDNERGERQEEDRLRAIIMLLNDRMRAEARSVLDSMGGEP